MWNVFVMQHGKSTSSRYVKFTKKLIKSVIVHDFKTHVLFIFKNGFVFIEKTSGAYKPRNYFEQALFSLFPPNFLHDFRCIVWGDKVYSLIVAVTASTLWEDVLDSEILAVRGLVLRPMFCDLQVQYNLYFWTECFGIDCQKCSYCDVFSANVTFSPKKQTDTPRTKSHLVTPFKVKTFLWLVIM